MKIVALFLFLGQVNVVLAQELSGTYKSNQNYLEFQNDSVCLRYKSPSGSFQQALYACGKCKWVEDFSYRSMRCVLRSKLQIGDIIF